MGAFALVAGAFLVLFVAYRFINNSTRRYPPGPKRYPIVGNAYAFPQKHKHLEFRNWGKQHGSDIVYADVLGTSVCVLNSMKAVRDLLDKKSAIYSDRPPMAVQNDILGFGGSVFIRYGEEFKEGRKIIQKQFSLQANKKYEAVQELYTNKFLANMLQDPKNMRQHINRVFSSSILKIVYGHELVSMDEDVVVAPQRLAEVATTITAVSIPAMLIDLFPILKRLPLSVFGKDFQRRVAEGHVLARQVFDDPFNDIKAKMGCIMRLPKTNSAPESMVQTLVNALSEKELNAGEIQKEEESIKRMAGHLYSASVDTSTNTVETFVLLMVLHPECFKKVRAEFDRVIGSERLPVVDDWKNLPYLNCVIKETLRWNPLLPLSIPHAITEDDEYKGYFIPKGSVVLPNVWMLMHDPEVFQNPEEFRPERYEEDNTLPDPSSVVFGFGRRICPGKYLGETNYALVIMRLVACFDISKAKDAAGREITPVPELSDGITSRPEPFDFSITPRSEKAIGLIKKAQVQEY